MKSVFMVAILTIGVIACGESGSTTTEAETVETDPTVPLETEPDRMELLSKVAETSGQAWVNGEWLTLHALFPDEFKAKCSGADFAELMLFSVSLIGMPEGATATVENVRVEGVEGFADIRFYKDGLELDIFIEDTEDDTPAFLWQDNRWIANVSPEDMAKDKPCELAWEVEEE